MYYLNISPTYYSHESVIGGGEKIIPLLCRALQEVVKKRNVDLETEILSLSPTPMEPFVKDSILNSFLLGDPWDVNSVNVNDALEIIDRADVVHVHHCFGALSMLFAAHAKLHGKIVIGTDHGRESYSFLAVAKDIAFIYDIFLANSEFGILSYVDYYDCFTPDQTTVIKGPIDTGAYTLNGGTSKDQMRAISVGKILPHKGFDRIIRTLPDKMELRIIGTPYDKTYLEYLHSISRGKNVTFYHGLNDSEVLDHLHSSGLYIHASTHYDIYKKFHYKPELLCLAPLEALSTGLTTFVSDAGALHELEMQPGCHVFHSDDELSILLKKYISNDLPNVEPEDKHRAVKYNYGLEQFGTKLIDILEDRV